MIKQLKRWLAKSFANGQWSARDWTNALRGNIPGAPITLDTVARTGAVVICGGLISSALASSDLALVQRLPGGGVRPITQHDAVNALASFTFADRASSVFDLACRANAWLWYLDGELSALDGSRVLVTIDSNNEIWLKQQGVDRYINADDETIHYMWHKQSGFYLASHPLMIANDHIATSIAIQAMGKALATNAQHPGGVLESPIALTQKAITNMKDSWSEAVGGEKIGGIAVLEQGVKYNGDLGLPTIADSEMTDALNWSLTSVAAYFGIPNSLVNVTTDTNCATAAEEGKLFRRSLIPWAGRCEDALTRKLVSPEDRARGLRIEHSLQSYAMVGLEQAQYWRELVAGGIAVANEARNAVGLADDPDGNRLRFPLNTGTAEQQQQQGAAHAQNG
jgi:HK97 family phage portal protein